MEVPIFNPGSNCWRISTVDRAAILIDAVAYFRAFKQAVLRAEHSILIVGWDFDSHTLLEWPDVASPDAPNELGPLLRHVAAERPELLVRVLVWDAPRLYSPDREWLAERRLSRGREGNIHFVRDNAHPIGGSHHQKLVIVDNRLAFVGGLDLSRDRLDSSAHAPNDDRRKNGDGSAYSPYHDVQVAIDGPVVRDLVELGAARWHDATGEELDREPAANDPWPETLRADFSGVEVAVARTQARWRDRPRVNEIERFYCDQIRHARHTVYFENQYLSSDTIADALCASLDEETGPEIVLVIPRDSTGWLEATTMGKLRDPVVNRLRAADRNDRLRILCPVVGETGNTAVKVHSKVTIVDDRYIRIGSSNLNNRSMGLDSELDLVFDVSPQSVAVDEAQPSAAASFRNRLLAEHLDCTSEQVAGAIAGHASMIAAIDALRAMEGRTLVDFQTDREVPVDPVGFEATISDPHGPPVAERIADSHARSHADRASLRRQLTMTALFVGIMILLGVAWRWGPLSEIDMPETMSGAAALFDSPALSIAAVVACFVLGSVVFAPLTAMVIATGMLFEPAVAFAGAFVGAILAALTGYGVGCVVGRRTVQRFAGDRVEKINRMLSRHGIVTVIVARNIPVAPFMLINIVAGASHISLRAFALGSAIGMAPGIFVMTVLADRFRAFLLQPDPINLAIFGLLVAMLAGIGGWTWRRFGDSAPAQRPD